jgi:TonB family protein
VRGASVKGAVAERVLPNLLPSAQESIEGKVNVSVRVAVDAGGNVSNATFDSPGPSKYFARQAMQAAGHWKFKPAQVDGKAVSSMWLLRFHFTQSGIEITPVEVSP